MYVGALGGTLQHDLDRRPLIHPYEFDPANSIFDFSMDTGAFTRVGATTSAAKPADIQGGFVGDVRFDEQGNFEGSIRGRAQGVPATPPAGPSGPRPIGRNSHLGVIVRGVRLPEDMGGRRDIAVILDIVTKASEPVTSMVVYYERDVPGGQMLNFQNLAVFYEDRWDGFTPPYFRLRVLDVKAERNARARDLLNRASNLGAAVTGLVPHPIIPAVTVAIEAAKLVLGNQRNQVLIDYQVNFYSLDQFRGSGRSDLGILAEGEWLVLGRPRGLPMWSYSPAPALTDQPWKDVQTGTSIPAESAVATTPSSGDPPSTSADVSTDDAGRSARTTMAAEAGSTSSRSLQHARWRHATPSRLRPTASNFWEQPLTLLRRSGQVVYWDGGVVAAPYVSVVITSAKMNVPTHVMDRSQQLITLLSTPGNASDTTGLANALEALASSVNLHVAQSRVVQHRTNQEVEQLATLLDRHLTSVENHGLRLVSVEEESEIVRFATEIVPHKQFVDTSAFVEWWKSEGRGGHIATSEDPAHRHGIIWRPGSPSQP